MESLRKVGAGMRQVRRLVRLPPGSPGRSPMAVPARRARPLGPTLTVSLALHLSLLVLLVVTIQHRPYRAEQIPPADFAMVFEGHSPELNSGPNPALTEPKRPGSPAPSVTVPPVPPAPAAPPPVDVLPLPPPPPPPQASAETHTAPAPPSPPDAKLPPTAPSPAPSPLAMAIPRPPPIPATPSPPVTPRTPPARTERQPERAPAFPTPLAFSLGLPGATTPNSATPRSTPPPREPTRVARPGQPGTIDLSFGPIAGGSLTPSSSVMREGVAVSTDWLNLVSAWWVRHRYYPPQAGANFEEGDVTLHMHVDHDGRVEDLELTGKSGSAWLDLGALSVFRGAYLPPLPPDMPEAQIPFEVTVHYIIIR